VHPGGGDLEDFTQRAQTVSQSGKDFLNFFSLEEKKQKNRTEIFLLK